MMRRRFPGYVILLLCTGGLAVAQPTGNLFGTVTSDQGERLPAVTSTLTGLGVLLANSGARAQRVPKTPWLLKGGR